MLQPRELKLEELGDLAEIIPGPEPALQMAVHPIPRFGGRARRAIIPVCEPTLSGNELKYVIVEGGQHSEAAWARRLPGALRFLLG